MQTREIAMNALVDIDSTTDTGQTLPHNHFDAEHFNAEAGRGFSFKSKGKWWSGSCSYTGVGIGNVTVAHVYIEEGHVFVLKRFLMLISVKNMPRWTYHFHHFARLSHVTT